MNFIDIKMHGTTVKKKIVYSRNMGQTMTEYLRQINTILGYFSTLQFDPLALELDIYSLAHHLCKV